MKGKFIVFEGIDGSGKTTQINQLSKWLTGSNLIPKNNQLVITREPVRYLSRNKPGFYY